MTRPPEYLPDPPKAAEAAHADALSDMLRSMRLAGGVFLDAEFSAPWCIVAQIGPEDCMPFVPAPAQVIAYHYVVAGELVLQVEAESPLVAAAGELVILPRNDQHLLGSAAGLRPVDATGLIQRAADGGLARIVHGGGGATTRLLCGFLASGARHNPVTASLPRVLTLRVEQGAVGEWIASSFRFAAHASREGSATVLTKLAELLFAEAVRQYLGGLPPGRTGWLAGLRDPIVGRALACLHGRVAQQWTTAQLASEVGLSRSAFAGRFSALLGEPPMRYLTRWRLQSAADQLQTGGEAVSRVAHAVGYESEAAFNRAFKREFGVPPATWRKQARRS